MFIIENDLIRVSIQSKGAELTSIYHKENELEYLWNAGPVWNKHSPVLFPVVGGLKDNTYFYKGKDYQLPPRHGFARDKEFIITKQSGSSIIFSLKQDEDTLKIYPFEFEFQISYALKENTLEVSYDVFNRSKGEMYFSVGGHPAFNVPLVKGTQYDDYYLEFNEAETAPRWPVSKDGLIEKTPIHFFNSTDVLPLSKELFNNDALVFKDLCSSIVSLKSDKTPRGLDFDFSGFPYLGIWATKGADFVCIEPWCGIADAVDTDQQLINKEGIIKLEMKERFSKTWKLTLF